MPDVQRILILAANPLDSSRLALGKEMREITRVLRRAKQREQFELMYELATRPSDIEQALLDCKPHIVHFCGHGVEEKVREDPDAPAQRDIRLPSEHNPSGGLVFENDEGRATLVSAKALANLFALFSNHVTCVVLNACYSEVQAKAIAQHIDAVVGMNQPITDTAAIKFAESFYRAIGAGKSVAFAYQLGCNRLERENLPAAQIPVLEQNPRAGQPIAETRPQVVNSYSQSGQRVTYQLSSGVDWSMQETMTWQVPRLLPYLPNRTDQEYELGKALQQLKAQRIGRPVVCLVHGDEYQKPGRFLDRLTMLSLTRLLGLERQTHVKTYPVTLPSPKKLENFRERLRKNLADRVIENNSGATAEQINQTFGQHPGPIVVAMHLPSSEWQRLGKGLLPNVLQFWQDWPELHPNQTLVFCLCIHYQSQRCYPQGVRGWCARGIQWIVRLLRLHRRFNPLLQLEQELERLAQTGFNAFDRVIGVVLPKLENVTQGHVEDWVRDKPMEDWMRSQSATPFVREALLDELFDAVQQMFEQQRLKTAATSMTMHDVAHQLKSVLESLTTNRGQQR